MFPQKKEEQGKAGVTGKITSIFSSVSYLWDILRITPCNSF